MSTFIRYLMSLVVHLAWRRAGRGGPVPPVRLPGKKGKPVDLPVIGTWQLMAAMWLVKKFWERYGHDVKAHLKTNTNDLARRASTFLPDPKNSPSAKNLSAATTAAPSPASPSPASAPSFVPAPRSAPNLHTQPLSPPNIAPATASSNGAPTAVPSGSLLSKLRGRS